MMSLNGGGNPGFAEAFIITSGFAFLFIVFSFSYLHGMLMAVNDPLCRYIFPGGAKGGALRRVDLHTASACWVCL